MASTSSFTMVSPRPEPIWRVGRRSDVYSRSKTWGRSTGSIPGPSSRTSIRQLCPEAPPVDTDFSETLTVVFANLIAFSIRFARIWARRSGSTEAIIPSSASSVSSSPSRSLVGRKPSAASVTRSVRSTDLGWRSKRRASSFANSRRSRTRRSSRRASDAITAAARCGSGASPSASASANPRIDVSGVRRSCETERRNCCSCFCARSSDSAMVLRSRISWPISSLRRTRAGRPSMRTDRSPEAIRR